MSNKSLTRNSIYNVIYKSLNVVFPLLTSMYVSRVLLSDGVGRVASAKNLVTYFTLLAALGLPIYGTKKIAEIRDNPDKISRTFSELFFINVVSTVFCTFAYFSVAIALHGNSDDKILYLIVGLQVILNIFNVDWFYQGIEEYGYIMIRSLIVKIICFGFIIVAVRNKEDYLLYALGSVLGVALNYVFNVFHLCDRIRFQFKNLNLRQHLKYLLVLFASAIAIEIYTLADITMLTAMSEKSNVGYYSNAVNGVKTIKELIVAICAVFLPRLSYYYSNNKFDEFRKLVVKGMKILLYFSIPAAIGCYMLADKIVLLLFGEGFYAAISTVRILSVSIVTIGLSNFIGYQVLVVIGKERRMLAISIFGALLNIVLNSVLIPKNAHNGAAFASAMTEIIVCILYCYSMYKAVMIEKIIEHIVSIIISVACMVVVVECIQLINMPNLVNCIVSVTLGGSTYIGLGVLQKNEISYLLVDKIKAIKKK